MPLEFNKMCDPLRRVKANVTIQFLRRRCVAFFFVYAGAVIVKSLWVEQILRGGASGLVRGLFYLVSNLNMMMFAADSSSLLWASVWCTTQFSTTSSVVSALGSSGRVDQNEVSCRTLCED